MTLRLIITKQTNPTFSEEMEYNRFPIFLGRESSNEVVLADPFKVISRKHAKIINTEGILQLVDLESANSTYLNDAKILPNEENAVKSGDKIKIGDYELQVDLVKEKEIQQEDDQKTMVFTSPYINEINNIIENLRLISTKFSLDNSPAKEKLLKFSIIQNLSILEKNEATSIIAECLSENLLEKEFNKISYTEGNNKNVFVKAVEPAVPSEIKVYNDRHSEDYSFNIHFSNTIDVLLDTFTKLLDGFLQFRQEFFGITKYYTIPTGSLAEVKEFLFNPGISSEEEKKRLGMIKDEIQKLLAHQLGLLEGYNLSITEGSKMLLQSLDPSSIEKEVEKKKPSGILNFSKASKVLDAIRENYRKYISDPYYIEKKFFRPSFIRGYQKRV